MIDIRPENAGDRGAVDEVNRLAFGGDDEMRLVQALRRSTGFIPDLSLVAEKEGQVVGHILFSPIAIETQQGEVAALSLAPMAVLPQLQRQGIGSELVRHGLEQCSRLEHRIVIVIGHPDFYPRFGFDSARAKGLESPFEVPDEAFMAVELFPGSLEGIDGTITYPPEFNEVS